MMAQMKRAIFLSPVFISAAAAVAVLGASAAAPQAAHAEEVAITDFAAVYGIGTVPNPCQGDGTLFACALAPSFFAYHASSGFAIRKITFDWVNGGGNNCAGYGHYGAIISSEASKEGVIATSSNTAYLGCAGYSNGTRGSAALIFDGQSVPETFYLTFGAFDNMVQGGSEITVRGVVIEGETAAATPVITPVVIVPGIMGSKLARVSDGTETWPNAQEMANSNSDAYLDALALPGIPMTAPDLVRTAAGTYDKVLGIPIPFSRPVYEPLITGLTAAGYKEGETLFVAPYDWRFSAADAASRVGDAVRAAAAHSADGKVDIIAHSMGGLAVKAYLAGAGGGVAAGGGAPVRKVILAGVPQLGAPLMLKALQYGDDLGFRFGPLQFLNPEEVKKIAQDMPGVYELLPSRRYVDIEGGYLIDAVRGGSTAPLGFDATAAYLTEDPDDARSATLLSAADNFHASLDAVPLMAGSAAVYNLVGCGVPTVKGFVAGEDGRVDLLRGNGDGTVPVTSAMNFADGYENYFVIGSVNGVDHAGLARDGAPLSLIRAILGDATATLDLVPLGVSRKTQDCFEGRVSAPDGTTEAAGAGVREISVHSSAPVEVGVKDGNGGEAASSTYDAVGNNYFITVPEDGSFTLEIGGGSSSTVTVEVTGRDGKASVTNEVTYVQVVLGEGSSTARLYLGGGGGSSGDLAIDDDGDGAPDRDVPPTAVLDAAAATDFEPPALTVSDLPLSVTAGATTTLVFSWSDAGSGLASSSATMNGARIVSGGTLVFGTPGISVVRLFSEDKAGNSRTFVREIYVRPAACRRSDGTIIR